MRAWSTFFTGRRWQNPTHRELFCFKPAIPLRSLKVYDASMKFVLLAIFVLFAAQPLQAASCDMHDGQDTSLNQHGNMHDSPMDDQGQDMDCCDHDPDNKGDACDSLSQCGAFAAGFVAVTPSTLDTVFSSNAQQIFDIADGILSRSGPPPFRPPIA